jgi:uncharacterized membrane protein (UPF0127 family)
MKYVFIGLGLFAIVLLSVALEPKKPTPPAQQQTLLRGTVVSGSTTIAVEVADTHLSRRQGLSGRTALPEGTGMLFAFEQEGAWGIWMKDMHFPIDIVWMDSAGRVLTVAHDVSPATYPNSFYPDAPSRYVLELPAGYARTHGIAEGSELVVQY